MPPVSHPGRFLKRELAARALSANRLAVDLGVPSGRRLLEFSRFIESGIFVIVWQIKAPRFVALEIFVAGVASESKFPSTTFH